MILQRTVKLLAKGVGGKKKLKFKTTERENASKRRRFIVGFIAIVLVLAVASVATYVRERKNPDSEKPSNSGMNTLPQTKMKEEVSLLFVGTSTNDNTPLFAAFIKFDTKDSKFTVIPVTVSGIRADKSQELANNISAEKDIPIDRYIVVNEKNFKNFAGVFGAFETDIKHTIDYKGEDFSLNLISGKQKLTGDKLFRYVRYLGLDGKDNSLKKQGELIADFLSQNLNEANASKGEDLFSSLINSAESDITIVDFSKYKDWLAEVAKEPRDVEVKLG